MTLPFQPGSARSLFEFPMQPTQSAQHKEASVEERGTGFNSLN